MKRIGRILGMLTAGVLLCFAFAGCGNQGTPTAGIQTDTAFSVTADDFLTQFIGLTMREPVFVSDKDSTVNAGGKIFLCHVLFLPCSLDSLSNCSCIHPATASFRTRFCSKE